MSTPKTPSDKILNTPVILKTDLVTTMTIHQQLLIALRHPKNTGPVREIAKRFSNRLSMILVKGGMMTQEEMDAYYRNELQYGSADLLFESPIMVPPMKTIQKPAAGAAVDETEELAKDLAIFLVHAVNQPDDAPVTDHDRRLVQDLVQRSAERFPDIIKTERGL